MSSLKKTAAALGAWQKEIVTKQKIESKEIPHPAAAPISADQEAADSVTTPSGERKYGNGEEIPVVRKP